MSDRPAITELLKQLRTELGAGKPLGEPDRTLLRQLAGDIEELLARPGAGTGGSHGPLVSRIEDAILRFEVTHPDLTRVLGGVSKSLSDMGV